MLCDLVEVRVPVEEGRLGTERGSGDDQVGGRNGDALPPQGESELCREIEVTTPKSKPVERPEVRFQLEAFSIS